MTKLEKSYQLQEESKYSDQTIHLDFVGNLNMAIEKMKCNPFCELEDAQIIQLKCCLLFLYGMPFSKIGEILSISTGKISRYLHDEKLEQLLSFEYKILFRKNQFRLKQESKEQKMKRAIVTFIETNGDYQKTAEITGLSDRTLSRYFADRKLEKVLGNSDLYQQFLKVKQQRISEIKGQAARIGIEQQKLKEIITGLDPVSLIEKRYVILCQAIFIEGLHDMKKIMDYTGMSERNIMHYLEETSKMEDFLPPLLLELLKQENLRFQCEEKQNIDYDAYEMAIIDLYMRGRYSFQDLSEIVGLKGSQIEQILTNRTKKLLSETEYEQFQLHKKEVTGILRKSSKNRFIIKDPRMIALVKPDFVVVNSLDYRLLEILVDFEEAYHNIQRQDADAFLFQAECFLSAKKNQLKFLLTESAYKNIERCLSSESLLYGNELQQKYEYVMIVVHEFFNHDFDLLATSTKLNMPIEMIIRALQNSFVKTNYGTLIAGYINQAIDDFRNKQKELDTREIGYTYFLKKTSF